MTYHFEGGHSIYIMTLHPIPNSHSQKHKAREKGPTDSDESFLIWDGPVSDWSVVTSEMFGSELTSDAHACACAEVIVYLPTTRRFQTIFDRLAANKTPSKRSTMPATKHHTLKCFKGHSGTKRKANLAAARAMKAAKRLESTEVPMEAGDVREHVLEASGFPDCSGDLRAENERLQQNRVESASASKLRKFRDHAGVQDNVCNDSGRSWVLMEVGQLNQLLSAALCSTCGQQTLSVVLDGKMGMAREMSLVCPDCDVVKKNFTSPRIGDSDAKNVAFEVNRLAVMFTHEVGGCYSALRKLCTVFGMPCLNEKIYYKVDKNVCSSIEATGEAVLDTTVAIVKAEYEDAYPNGRPDEGDQDWEDMPWVDVSFDGSWHKRGFTSNYGVGVVIDVLTGYVLDFEVLSKYCHVCAVNADKVEQMTDAEKDAWEQRHAPDCCRNYEGSSKAMEREAALRLWNR